MKPKNLVVPTILSIAAWALECFALAVILFGFEAHVPIALSVFFYATSTLAGAVIPVPGGIGVTETGLREQMMTMGHVDEGTSTAAMILVRFATLCPVRGSRRLRRASRSSNAATRAFSRRDFSTSLTRADRGPHADGPHALPWSSITVRCDVGHDE